VAALAELAADSLGGPGEGDHLPGAETRRGPNRDLYELFGVVNHIGKLDRCAQVVLARMSIC
jgi:hypothetical protein